MLLDHLGRPIGGALTEEQTTRLMAEELARKDAPLILGPLTPLEALSLAGVLQLARRHPELAPPFQAIAADIVDTVREYFDDSPTVLAVLDAGDDPEQDVTRG